MGEAVGRSIEWLIKRLIKVGAKVAYHRSEVVSACGVRVSFGPTLPCSVLETSAVEKAVDGVREGEVRSKRGEKDLFRQRDDGFAVLLPLEGPFGVFFGAGGTEGRLDSESITPESGRPPHNSG